MKFFGYYERSDPNAKPYRMMLHPKCIAGFHHWPKSFGFWDATNGPQKATMLVRCCRRPGCEAIDGSVHIALRENPAHDIELDVPESALKAVADLAREDKR